jgi:hypothetical protein
MLGKCSCIELHLPTDEENCRAIGASISFEENQGINYIEYIFESYVIIILSGNWIVQCIKVMNAYFPHESSVRTLLFEISKVNPVTAVVTGCEKKCSFPPKTRSSKLTKENLLSNFISSGKTIVTFDQLMQTLFNNDYLAFCTVTMQKKTNSKEKPKLYDAILQSIGKSSAIIHVDYHNEQKKAVPPSAVDSSAHYSILSSRTPLVCEETIFTAYSSSQKESKEINRPVVATVDPKLLTLRSICQRYLRKQPLKFASSSCDNMMSHAMVHSTPISNSNLLRSLSCSSNFKQGEEGVMNKVSSVESEATAASREIRILNRKQQPLIETGCVVDHSQNKRNRSSILLNVDNHQDVLSKRGGRTATQHLTLKNNNRSGSNSHLQQQQSQKQQTQLMPMSHRNQKIQEQISRGNNSISAINSSSSPSPDTTHNTNTTSRNASVFSTSKQLENYKDNFRKLILFFEISKTNVSQ